MKGNMLEKRLKNLEDLVHDLDCNVKILQEINQYQCEEARKKQQATSCKRQALDNLEL